ncbi:hypothetical protein [Xanthobacter versatilis]|uniref:hypothetical protein n=1 Tax=Xanthobacter autotrophicus (strain ATCC BAA-1158 / Py2) TaxID=78245 RepID=UPI00372C9713
MRAGLTFAASEVRLGVWSPDENRMVLCAAVAPAIACIDDRIALSTAARQLAAARRAEFRSDVLAMLGGRQPAVEQGPSSGRDPAVALTTILKQLRAEALRRDFSPRHTVTAALSDALDEQIMDRVGGAAVAADLRIDRILPTSLACALATRRQTDTTSRGVVCVIDDLAATIALVSTTGNDGERLNHQVIPELGIQGQIESLCDLLVDRMGAGPTTSPHQQKRLLKAASAMRAQLTHTDAIATGVIELFGRVRHVAVTARELARRLAPSLARLTEALGRAEASGDGDCSPLIASDPVSEVLIGQALARPDLTQVNLALALEGCVRAALQRPPPTDGAIGTVVRTAEGHLRFDILFTGPEDVGRTIRRNLTFAGEGRLEFFRQTTEGGYETLAEECFDEFRLLRWSIDLQLTLLDATTLSIVATDVSGKRSQVRRVTLDARWWSQIAKPLAAAAAQLRTIGPLPPP